jgi:hypothetical protein
MPDLRIGRAGPAAVGQAPRVVVAHAGRQGDGVVSGRGEQLEHSEGFHRADA